MTQVTKRARNALCGAAVCFLVVDVLLAASIGVADWFQSTQAIRFQKVQLDDTGYGLQETWLTDKHTSVHGRVMQDFKIVCDLSKGSQTLGSFSCNLKIDWDYWRGNTKASCDESHDAQLPMEMRYYADFFCNDDNYGVCRRLEAIVASNDDPSCKALSKAAKYFGETDPISSWDEKAVCSGAKGVLAVLVLAVVSATVGLCMCWFCSTGRKPRWIIIPGLLCTILSAIAVVSYGAAISGNYPHDAALKENLRISDKDINPEVVAASSSVQTVEVGFGLGIAAAVIALITCWLAFTAGYIAMSDVELQVVSAIPIQIFQNEQLSAPQGDGYAQHQPVQVVTATAVEYPVIARANVVVEAEVPSEANGHMSMSTPHTESRVVRSPSGAGSAHHPAPSSAGSGHSHPARQLSGSVLLPDHPPVGAGGHHHDPEVPHFEAMSSAPAHLDAHEGTTARNV